MKTNATIVCHAGDDPNVTAAKLLIMAAQMATDPPPGAPAESVESAKVFLDSVLAAAATGGYAQCDLLRAALASTRRANRLSMMAREACKAAGPAALRNLIAGSPD